MMDLDKGFPLRIPVSCWFDRNQLPRDPCADG